MIDLPIRGFNSIVQDNVQRTRMGDENKCASSKIGRKYSTTSFEAALSYAYISFKTKTKKNKNKNKNCMLPKVTCEIYATKTLVEGGANLVFCKNCDPEMFV